MKSKEKLIQDLNQQLTSVVQERDRLKAENSMLRMNAKDKKKSEVEDVYKLQ